MRPSNSTHPEERSTRSKSEQFKPLSGRNFATSATRTEAWRHVEASGSRPRWCRCSERFVTVPGPRRCAHPWTHDRNHRETKESPARQADAAAHRGPPASRLPDLGHRNVRRANDRLASGKTPAKPSAAVGEEFADRCAALRSTCAARCPPLDRRGRRGHRREPPARLRRRRPPPWRGRAPRPQPARWRASSRPTWSCSISGSPTATASTCAARSSQSSRRSRSSS